MILSLRVALLLDDHADAVVMTTLVFAQTCVSLGIVEVRMGIEHAQHSRYRAVIDPGVGFVAGNWLGVVLLNQRIDFSERLQAVAKLALVSCRLRSNPA